MSDLTKNNANTSENKPSTFISFKVAKKLVGEPFISQNKEYVEIKLPNASKDDKRPWQTFVLRSSQVNTDKYSKGVMMYVRIPENAQITLNRDTLIISETGEKTYGEPEKTQISAKELKQLCADNYKAYKNEKKTSVSDKINNNIEAIKKSEIDFDALEEQIVANKGESR